MWILQTSEAQRYGISMMLPDLDGDTNFGKPTGDENTPQHQTLLKQTASSMLPQLPTAESDAETHPGRTPMLQLPQNPASLPALLPLLSSAVSLKGKDGPPLGTRLGGSTTHRDNRQVSPGQWLPASSSGAFTARGESTVTLHLICLLTSASTVLLTVLFCFPAHQNTWDYTCTLLVQNPMHRSPVLYCACDTCHCGNMQVLRQCRVLCVHKHQPARLLYHGEPSLSPVLLLQEQLL